MTLSEKLCVKWNDFKQNTLNVYQNLRNDSDLSDVTLVCEGDQQIEAHKIVLSACSPFFNTVLKRNKHPHPLIYIRVLKDKDMNAMIDFIYHGEANIFQEDLDGFLALAKDLQLKGLAPSEDVSSAKKSVNYPKVQKLQEGEFPQGEKEHFKPTKESEPFPPDTFIEYTSIGIVPKLPIGEMTVHLDTNSVEYKIGSMMEKVRDGEYSWSCRVCGKMTKGSPTQMKRHVETHLDGISYPCTICGKVSSNSNQFRNHLQNKLKEEEKYKE